MQKAAVAALIGDAANALADPVAMPTPANFADMGKINGLMIFDAGSAFD